MRRARGRGDVETLGRLGFVEVVGLLTVDSEAFESEFAFRHGELVRFGDLGDWN